MDARISPLCLPSSVYADSFLDDRAHYLTAQDTLPRTTTHLCNVTLTETDLPVWSWRDGSCALDSTLVTLVAIAIHLKDEFVSFAACGNFVSRQVAIEIDKWGRALIPPWSWASSSPESMNELRDTVRALLLDPKFIDQPIEIDRDTAIDLSLEKTVFPPDMVEWSSAVMHRCVYGHGETVRCGWKNQRGLSVTIRNGQSNDLDIQSHITKAVSIPMP